MITQTFLKANVPFWRLHWNTDQKYQEEKLFTPYKACGISVTFRAEDSLCTLPQVNFLLHSLVPKKDILGQADAVKQETIKKQQDS